MKTPSMMTMMINQKTLALANETSGASFKVAGAVADGLQGPWLRYYVAVSTRA